MKSTKPTSSSELIGVYDRSTSLPSVSINLRLMCCPTGRPRISVLFGNEKRYRRTSWLISTGRPRISVLFGNEKRYRRTSWLIYSISVIGNDTYVSSASTFFFDVDTCRTMKPIDSDNSNCNKDYTKRFIGNIEILHHASYSCCCLYCWKQSEIC